MPFNTKFIFVTGGVLSSLGKGLASAALGALLQARGYTDLIARYLGSHAYSYLHAGQLGYLDHALANRSLLEQVSGATIWHINADEPDIFAYRERGAQPRLYPPGPYRSADHDPLVIGLELR